MRDHNDPTQGGALPSVPLQPVVRLRDIPGGIRYIRHTYGVPAKRGMRITWHHAYDPHSGTIVGARFGYIRVKLDGMKRVVSLHPEDNVEYHTKCKPNPGRQGTRLVPRTLDGVVGSPNHEG